MEDSFDIDLGMFVKVRDFLTQNSAPLAVITQLATVLSTLNTKIGQLTTYLGAAGADTSGYTLAKSLSIADDIEQAMKVSKWGAAYYHSINDMKLKNKVSFKISALQGMRDSELYKTLKQLYADVSPVKASLVPFAGTSTGVDLLQTRNEAFFLIIEAPKEATEDKAVAKENATRVNGEIKALLDGDCDTYMDAIDTINHSLFLEYEFARSLDNESGGGSPGETVNVTLNDNTPFTVVFNTPILAGDTITVVHLSGPGANGGMTPTPNSAIINGKQYDGLQTKTFQASDISNIFYSNFTLVNLDPALPSSFTVTKN